MRFNINFKNNKLFQKGILILIFMLDIVFFLSNYIISKNVLSFYIYGNLFILLNIIVFGFLFYANFNVIFKIIKDKFYSYKLGFISIIFFVISITILILIEFLYGNESFFHFSELKNIILIIQKILFFCSLFSLCVIIFTNKHNDKVNNFDISKRKFVYLFIVITTLFVTLKLIFPLIFPGLYGDELYHIYSALDYSKLGKFPQFYINQGYYNRGIDITILVTVLFKIFGPSIYFAKLVPAIIGLIDYFLIYKISKKLEFKNWAIILLLLIYSVSNWIILNHFYIRMYVIYEFSILSITLTSLYIHYFINKNELKKLIFSLIIFTMLFAQNFFLSNDDGKELINIYSLIILTYFFLFEIHKLNVTGKIRSIFNLNIKKKVLLLMFIFTCIIVPFNFVGKINALLFGVFPITSSINYKYSNFFMNFNGIFTIFFLCSIFYVLKKDKFSFIYIGALFLFTLHNISSQDLQITRAILYLVPLFYIVSIKVFSELKIHFLIKLFFILLLFISIFNSYPKNFFISPSIPSEVNMQYQDYKSIYTFTENFCRDSIIYSLVYVSAASDLYGINNIKIFYPYKYAAKDISFYFDKDSNIYKTSYKNLSIYDSDEKLISQYYIDKPSCLLYPKNNQAVFDKTSVNNLIKLYKYSIDFDNISIYYNLY